MPTFLKRWGVWPPPSYANAIGYIPLIKASSAFLGDNTLKVVFIDVFDYMQIHYCLKIINFSRTWIPSYHGQSLCRPGHHQTWRMLKQVWRLATSQPIDVAEGIPPSSSITEKYRALEVCK